MNTSIHKINHDAIAQGVLSFIVNWPSDVEKPNSVPRDAHQILWTDDFWRGVDMAREEIAQAFGWSEWQEPAACTRIERATIFMVRDRRIHGQVLQTIAEYANLDAVDVIEAALLGIIETGDSEHRTEAPRSCDDDVAADTWVEA